MKRIDRLRLRGSPCCPAFAATRSLYRIELRDGREVFSRDRPVRRGTILLFYADPGEALTGLTDEEVLEVTPADRRVLDRASARQAAPREIAPGEVIDLGLTPGEPAPAEAAATTPRPASIPGGVYDPRSPLYRGYGAPGGAPAPGTSGDLTRAISEAPPTANPPIGADGFPATTAPSFPVDANGFPLTTGAAATTIDENGFAMIPGSSAPAIGPDGQPILGPTGAPGSAPPVIGPNGTPVLAPAGTPGSSPVTIGPNGTPVLGPPGSPGTAPPAVGPNGYPAAPPPPAPRR